MDKRTRSKKTTLTTDPDDACEKNIVRIRDLRRKLYKKPTSPLVFEVPAKHTILVIDNEAQERSEFHQFCGNNAEKLTTKFDYNFFSVPMTGKSLAENEARLKEIICFEKKLTGSEALVHLRAAIIMMDDSFHSGRVIREYFPNLPIFFVNNDNGSESSNGNFPKDFINKKLCFTVNQTDTEATMNMILGQIDQIISDYAKTPFWDSLKGYADNPAVNFHCLPLGGGRSITPSIRDFGDFFGQNHFNAETSLATFPLDSLLMPHGAIKQAQQKAAIAFGAHVNVEEAKNVDGDFFSHETGTRFVTNGTTAANQIIISAFVRPNDYVMLERNCHLSHFNAVANSYAKPLFLKPFVNSIGIAGPSPLEAIRTTLSKHLEEKNSLPALIILTNPTFDGIFYKPEKVVATIEAVLSDYWNKYHGDKRFAALLETLAPFLPSADEVISAALADKDVFIYCAFRRMVFLFDEAWGANAYFHPRLIKYSAMHSAMMLSQNKEKKFHGCLRFYSSQSTHKSFSAFRQGSMIHYRDPLRAFPEFRIAFESSFCSNTTSSPNANILASLDVARKQAQLDGLYMVERSIQLAEQFRQFYVDHFSNDENHVFSVAGNDQMLKSIDSDGNNLDADDYAFDPTKVTITWSLPIAGQKIRELLLHSAIQINKYNSKSILLIFNIGITESSVQKLKSALLAMSTELVDSIDNKQNVPVISSLPVEKIAVPYYAIDYNQHDLGYWQKNLGGFSHALIDVEKMYNEMQQQEKTISDIFISAAFVTPYPPGNPVLIPGQEISAQDLGYLKDIPINAILGVEAINGRMNIHVYLKGTAR